jgi:hypothetical protein
VPNLPRHDRDESEDESEDEGFNLEEPRIYIDNPVIARICVDKLMSVEDAQDESLMYDIGTHALGSAFQTEVSGQDASFTNLGPVFRRVFANTKAYEGNLQAVLDARLCSGLK